MNRNGLTSITIENFKGIGAPVTIPLRPVTLLFGANSAGKSTIIQALQYAWEVLENRNPDVDRTRIGGEVIDLGGFKNLVHQHDLDRSIKITLEYKGDLKNEAYLLPEFYYSYTTNEVSAWEGVPDISTNLNIDNITVQIVTSWDHISSRAVINVYEVGINGLPFARIQRLPLGRVGFVVYDVHSLFPDRSAENYCPGNDFMSDLMERCADELGGGWGYEDRDESLLESIFHDDNEENLIFVNNTIPEWGKNLSPYHDIIDDKGNKRRKVFDEEILSIISQLVVGSGETVLDELRELRYLGPLREVPNRTHTAPLKSESSRWANGLGAWDALLRNPDVSSGNSPEVTLVERCSDYMHDTLGIPYRLRREDRIQLPADDGGLFARLRLMASRFEELEGRELQHLVSEIAELGRIPVVQLHDEKNDIDVSLMDIGVGISQTLPVVVGAVEPNCSIFAVEQPELHIHPAVQVELADILLREVLETDNPRIFLLETHSEHLVLRIMRRMRETCENTLPDTFPEVKPEDVAVLYVEVVDGHSIVREMPLNERGELIKAWPGGFFEEGLRETL